MKIVFLRFAYLFDTPKIRFMDITILDKFPLLPAPETLIVLASRTAVLLVEVRLVTVL